jgi:hypothetical protein
VVIHLGLHGEVIVWQMTEEERLAYIAKHPIVPKERPAGVKFSNIHEMKRKEASMNGYKNGKQANSNNKILDEEDKKFIHEQYSTGSRLHEIAEMLGVEKHTINNFINAERKRNSQAFPRRTIR